MNFDPLKHNTAFEVPLMYLRILLNIFQCSLPRIAMNRLTTLTTSGMFGLVQTITNIKLSITNAYGVRDSFILSTLLLGLILEDNF